MVLIIVHVIKIKMHAHVSVVYENKVKYCDIHIFLENIQCWKKKCWNFATPMYVHVAIYVLKRYFYIYKINKRLQ